MPFVTVKPKFQVTIPAKLRRDIDLHEGDIMEATLVDDGILFRPKEVVDRNAAADRIAANFAAAQPQPGDLDRSEDEIMTDTISEIADSAENAATVRHEGCPGLQRSGVGSPDRRHLPRSHRRVGAVARYHPVRAHPG